MPFGGVNTDKKNLSLNTKLTRRFEEKSFRNKFKKGERRPKKDEDEAGEEINEFKFKMF